MHRLRIAAIAALALAVSPAVAGRQAGNWHNVYRDGVTPIDGSGRIVRIARPATAAFSAIALEGPTTLEITVGAAPSVEVETDDNLIDHITTRVEDGVLVIDTTGSFRTQRAPAVRVTLPALASLRTRGSGDARISGVSGGDLELSLRGSGAIVVDGRAAKVAANLYGSGVIDLTRLGAPDLAVALYGSGDARVRASERLSATVFGSGDIVYSGDPLYLERRVRGSGSIRHVD